MRGMSYCHQGEGADNYETELPLGNAPILSILACRSCVTAVEAISRSVTGNHDFHEQFGQ